MKRVIFTGDLLRPDRAMKHNCQTPNIMWFSSLLRYILSEATDLPVVTLTNDNAKFGYYRSYEAAGFEPGWNEWASLFSSVPPVIADAWAEEMRDAIVVGFELPDSVRDALTNAGIVYIDGLIHPVRFMDDIFFAFRSNSDEINAKLSEVALKERLIYRAAGAVSAFSYRKGLVQREDPFSLFVAQMAVDRSMIQGGELLTRSNLTPSIREALGHIDVLLFSDHPYEPATELFKVACERAEVVTRTKRNMYALLSNPSLTEVITISSSVGTEAKYFEKPAKFVIGPSTPVLYDGDEDDGRSYWSIFNAFMGPDFWRDILSPVMKTTQKDGDPISWRPNLLRSSLRLSWAYEDILYDRPQAPTPPKPATAPPTDPIKLKGSAKLKRELVRPFYRLAGKRDIR